MITAAGVPCGPINTIDGGIAFAESVGLDPVVLVGEGDAAVPSVRHPIRLSRRPADYRLPPPGLDEHGDEIRRWLAEPVTSATRSVTHDHLPHVAGHVRAPTRSACSARTSPPT